MGRISNYSQLVRNNGGGFYNHNFFWQCLTPAGTAAMDDSLMQVIVRNFGSFDQFREQFSKAASTVFGSGWAWLIQQDGKLKITVTPNQDNPLMDLVTERGKPLLAIDVWEHAYYLKYQNKRSDYIASFWNIVNWDFVKQNLGI
jgi:Fe-Mn family superoxide dismutase